MTCQLFGQQRTRFTGCSFAFSHHTRVYQHPFTAFDKPLTAGQFLEKWQIIRAYFKFLELAYFVLERGYLTPLERNLTPLLKAAVNAVANKQGHLHQTQSCR